jgi:integrase
MRNGFEPEGVVLQRGRITVAEIIDDYIQAGCPTRKMDSKRPITIAKEVRFSRPVREYFADTSAAALTLGDCDKYRDWRLTGGYVTERKLRNGKTRQCKTRGGKRAVDLELTILSNALNRAERRGVISCNPIVRRGRYTSAAEVRHCREVAPTPEGLQAIIGWLRERNETAVADLVAFLGFSGLRLGEALPLTWQAVNLAEGLINVQREKRGVNPWVAILPEMETLLRDMLSRAKTSLLFPSPFEPSSPRDQSAVRHRLTAACKALRISHVTPHGMRSYFVTQARQSGLTDAEIAMLIGDKTGPSIIATTYGDLRDDHLLAQARRIRLSVAPSLEYPSVKASHMSPENRTVSHSDSVCCKSP